MDPNGVNPCVPFHVSSFLFLTLSIKTQRFHVHKVLKPYRFVVEFTMQMFQFVNFKTSFFKAFKKEQKTKKDAAEARKKAKTDNDTSTGDADAVQEEEEEEVEEEVLKG